MADTKEVQVSTHKGVYPIPVGAPFAETIKKLAEELGVLHFRLYLAGVEVGDPERAPAVVEEGMTISLFPYDKAAG